MPRRQGAWYDARVLRPQWLPTRSDVPGLVLASAIAIISVGLAHALPPSPFVSDVMLALLIGAIIVNTPIARMIGMGGIGKEREPDRFASGLRYIGKWLLRIAIILMGMKVQTSFFGRGEVTMIFGVAAVSLPSAFFVAHIVGSMLGVRRPLVDLLAGGTMICGASAVNAIAPVVGAHREEQGVSIAVMFLFSVVAMLSFRTVALLLGLDPAASGVWSGLAVNDLSSAIAVGTQMGGEGGIGGVMAAASKSARILLLAPVLVALALARRSAPVQTSGDSPMSKRSADAAAAKDTLGKRIVEALPGFLVGYVGLAIVRALCDRWIADNAAWHAILGVDKLLVDLLMAAVSAGIGLHLSLRTILGSSARSVAVGGMASVWTAGITLLMITLVSRGSGTFATVVGVGAVVVTYLGYRTATRAGVRVAQLRKRFQEGDRVTLAEAKTLLDAFESDATVPARPFEDALLRRLLDQLSPSIGELIPARTSPLPHGEGCRWVTYWEGKSGWALVAIVREPGSMTPIHAHPHRLLGKAIEGVLEEMRFKELAEGSVELVSREILGHEQLVETDGLATLHVVRAHGAAPAIDLQMRGPESGKPGRRLVLREPVELTTIAVGTHIAVREEIDDRPGHGGEGASVGRVAS